MIGTELSRFGLILIEMGWFELISTGLSRSGLILIEKG
jgi:hypothetical protein